MVGMESDEIVCIVENRIFSLCGVEYFVEWVCWFGCFVPEILRANCDVGVYAIWLRSSPYCCLCLQCVLLLYMVSASPMGSGETGTVNSSRPKCG